MDEIKEILKDMCKVLKKHGIKLNSKKQKPFLYYVHNMILDHIKDCNVTKEFERCNPVLIKKLVFPWEKLPHFVKAKVLTHFDPVSLCDIWIEIQSISIIIDSYMNEYWCEALKRDFECRGIDIDHIREPFCMYFDML